MRATDEYRQIVGDKVVSEILQLARNLYGLRVLHINPTRYFRNRSRFTVIGLQLPVQP